MSRTTIINEVSGQEIQALQVFGRCSREGHDFSDSLVETLVGSVPQEVGQVAISHLVLVVTHLMVCSEEVVHVDHGAHFDPEDVGEKCRCQQLYFVIQRWHDTISDQ